jgi:uncharacterized protein
VEAFNTLREQLELLDWPNVYLFKFIMPNDEANIAKIIAFFDENADINLQPSGKGNYTSLSVKTVMLTVDEIITIYKKASAIKGVISL